MISLLKNTIAGSLYFLLLSFQTAHTQWLQPDQSQIRTLRGTTVLPPVFPYRIPLTIHIIRRSNGSDPWLTLDQLNLGMQDLNYYYASNNVGIQFFIYGNVIYIDSDFWFNIPDIRSNRDLLLQQNVVANTVNVYFGNLGCGATPPNLTTDPNQGVIMNRGCILEHTTLAHEMGHHFNLKHTHDTDFGVECPDGSNGNTTGDLVSDTPADPNLSNKVDSATCRYIGTVPPPAGCGPTLYNPQTNNLMAYTWPHCANLFTPGQATRMRVIFVIASSCKSI